MGKWQVSLSLIGQQAKHFEQLQEPFGFSTDTTAPAIEQPRRREMLEKQLMDLATASKTQIFSTAFMFWMMGSNVSIFVLFAVMQAATSAVGGILNFTKVFQPFEGMLPSLSIYKVIYLSLQTVMMGLLAYKLSQLGLLPVTAPDYVGLLHPFREAAVIFRT